MFITLKSIISKVKLDFLMDKRIANYKHIVKTACDLEHFVNEYRANWYRSTILQACIKKEEVDDLES